MSTMRSRVSREVLPPVETRASVKSAVRPIGSRLDVVLTKSLPSTEGSERSRDRGLQTPERMTSRRPIARDLSPANLESALAFRAQEVEATTGFEPVNRGFADLRVEPLHHVAVLLDRQPMKAWLPLEDSNLGSRIQSPLSYR